MNFLGNAPLESTIIIYLLFVWSLIWKGIALWRAAKNEQRNWYIAMLVLNTAGLLEIIYLFRFAKKPMKVEELMFWNRPTHHDHK